jgi:hypothetical protein
LSSKHQVFLDHSPVGQFAPPYVHELKT